MFCWFLINLAFLANLPMKKSSTTTFLNYSFILEANCSYTFLLLYFLILAFCKKSHIYYNFPNSLCWTTGKWRSSNRKCWKLAVEILLGLCRTILSLSNLHSTNFSLKLFSQFDTMPPFSQRIFSGWDTYQKKRKSGLRHKTKGHRASKEKHSRKSYQKEQKKWYFWLFNLAK